MDINIIDTRLGLCVLLDGTDIRVQPEASLESIVAMILGRLGSQKIRRLNICGHARPGVLQLGRDNLSIETCTRLKALRNRFAGEDGGIFLFGSSVAAEAPATNGNGNGNGAEAATNGDAPAAPVAKPAPRNHGPALCLQLAELLNQPVYASPECHQVTSWARGTILDFESWDGSLKCFRPDGSVTAAPFALAA
jgi:hypothetical protein